MPAKQAAGWFPRRGEILRARFPGGKLRPGIVLSGNWLNRFALDVCVVPLTTVHHREFSLRVPVRTGEGGVDRDSWAKCDQVHTIEKRALLYPPLGRLPAATMGRIEEAVRLALEL